jgi:predicted nucleotidyltransferase
LAAQRLARVQHVARADLYQLNDDHVLAPRVRELFAGEATLREQLIEYLRSELPRRIGKAQGAFLFGSASRGTTRSSSDIDVAIVGAERSEAQLEPELSALSDIVRERFGSELNVIIDAGKRSARGRPKLWQRIEKEGISLLNPSSRHG